MPQAAARLDLPLRTATVEVSEQNRPQPLGDALAVDRVHRVCGAALNPASRDLPGCTRACSCAHWPAAPSRWDLCTRGRRRRAAASPARPGPECADSAGALAAGPAPPQSARFADTLSADLRAERPPFSHSTQESQTDTETGGPWRGTRSVGQVVKSAVWKQSQSEHHVHSQKIPAPVDSYGLDPALGDAAPPGCHRVPAATETWAPAALRGFRRRSGRERRRRLGRMDLGTSRRVSGRQQSHVLRRHQSLEQIESSADL
jgi:hypothetical protein